MVFLSWIPNAIYKALLHAPLERLELCLVLVTIWEIGALGFSCYLIPETFVMQEIACWIYGGLLVPNSGLIFSVK